MTDRTKMAMIGAGSWGTAASGLAAHVADIRLWARRKELADAINATRTNPDYLADVELPAAITATADLEEAVDGADVIVMAVPSHGYRGVLENLSGVISTSVPIVSLAKGIEQDTLMRMTEVTIDVLPDHDPGAIGVLTGPNLAREIAAGQPAASVVAMGSGDVALRMQSLFMSHRFRVYTNPDVIGCEAAGALKNVMAIASGMAHGLGFGENTTATLITRALNELSRLGVAMGGQTITFAGLAGMGDLIATCVSSKSRNHTVGFGLGEGRKLDDVISEMNMVAEGVKSTRGVLALAERHDVEMPIAEQVGRVLYEGATAEDAMTTLMARAPSAEW
jgi:glycerol-3-phosphate dehydrogenase (NAD(P)+)